MQSVTFLHRVSALMLVALVSVVFGGVAEAASVFTNRVDFDAATTSVANNDLKSSFATAASVDFGDFSLSSTESNGIVASTSIGAWGVLRPTEVISFEFDSPITAFGVDVIDWGTTNIPNELFASFGSSSQVFGTESIAAITTNYLGYNNVIFFGLINAAPFTKVTFSASTSNGDVVNYADLTYGAGSVETVPVPSAGYVGLVAFGLMSVVRRRRKA